MSLLPWGKRAENIKRAEELVSECCQRMEIAEKSLGKSGREWIRHRRWPDDAAEMRRIVYYAVLSAPGKTIEARHFPPRGKVDIEAYVDKKFDSIALEDIVYQKLDHFFERLGKVEACDVHKAVLKQVERPLIGACLRWAGGNQVKAARVLGMSRGTLRAKIKELGIK